MPVDKDDIHPLKRAFADELRHLRDAAGLSQLKLGEALGCTGQWVGQVENGEKDPSLSFARDLDTFFKLPGSFERQCLRLRAARRDAVHLPGFPAFAELEAQARRSRSFHGHLVPGPLQTDDYARAIMERGLKPEVVEARLAALDERRSLLTREAPPISFLWIIDEAVLRRPVGGRRVMARQLDALLEFVDGSRHELRVQPFDVVAYGGMLGSFWILTLPDLTEVVYQEGPGVGQVISSPLVVDENKMLFDQVMCEAARRETSLQMISCAREAFS
ncbi:helix-turn-helix transcriptional regulator [Actinocorallia lasiicapitis]